MNHMTSEFAEINAEHSLTSSESSGRKWNPGTAPVAVIMISLNESHNMQLVLDNLQGWAQEVFLVDSYSQDETVDVALKSGVHVVQRRFRGFGDQWNFALDRLPITAPWTMKLDPDERLSDELKRELQIQMTKGPHDAMCFSRRLWFMGQALPIRQNILRVWRTGTCRFTDISVNEHPKVAGNIVQVAGDLEHHDSPDLEHWLDKQNHYSTAEAIIWYRDLPLADQPKLFGTSLQRQMWFKRNLRHLPFRYFILFLFYWLIKGTYRAGWVGYAWARLRSDVMRLREYKMREIRLTGRLPVKRRYGSGEPDARVQKFD